MLKGLESQLKAVHLEVAFTMMTEKNAQQITRTYCARPDLIVKKRDDKTFEVLATGEVASSPAIQSYLATLPEKI